jgi:hypothetical protein
MPKYQVIEAGAVIFEEDGDDYKSTIPAELLARPEDADPFPPARMIVEDGQIIGMQICQAEEDHIATLADAKALELRALGLTDLSPGADVDAHVDAQLTVALDGLGLEVFQ